MDEDVINIVIAGIGGQGVLRASDILAETAFRFGKDVKKSEIHGMSQRGGSVHSDVRFGKKIYSPMVPDGQADFLLVLNSDQMEVNQDKLKEGGILISPENIDLSSLPNKKCLNTALLGVLSQSLEFSEKIWMEVIHQTFVGPFQQDNFQAFYLGRTSSFQNFNGSNREENDL